MKFGTLSSTALLILAAAITGRVDAWTNSAPRATPNFPPNTQYSSLSRDNHPPTRLSMYIPRENGQTKEVSMRAVAVNGFSSSSSSRRKQTTDSPQLQEVSSSSSSDFWFPVISSALLITGNTFGAGSLVLPTLAAEPGLGASGAIFALAYVINLISGLCIANVAIQQYEDDEHGQDVPGSFKEFVQANLQSPELAVIISLISFSVNALVFSFDMSRVGVLFSGLLGSPTVGASVWGATLLMLSTALSPAQLSQVASVCVMALFATFGTLLIPGLASLTDPLQDWMTPGTAAMDPTSFAHACTEITPIIVMSLVFQNIVPAVVKLQDYDRARTFTSIGLGSFIPLVMYVSWCWACLGQGGIDLAATMEGIGSNPLLSAFSLATLAGSSIGCMLSCASELDIFVKQFLQDSSQPASASTTDPDPTNQGRFQWTSILATVALPLSLNWAFADGGDLTGALHLAGGLGSPLLYGVIPVLMTLKQQEKQKQEESANADILNNMGLGMLGIASTGMFCGNFLDFVSTMVPTDVPSAIAATETLASL